jgi:chorismate mutase/prephenate dehydratase
MKADIKAIREKLDQLDRQLVEVLARRQRLVEKVVAAKADTGTEIRDPDREQDLLATVRSQARDSDLDPGYVEGLFRHILEQSLRVQSASLLPTPRERRATISYQGSAGAYSELAAKRHFAGRDLDLTLRGETTFQAVLAAVRSGRADYAMLPVENTTAGSVTGAYDLLAESRLVAVGEEVLPVRHCLIGLEAQPLSAIRRVISHPQALAQCSEFIDTMVDCVAEAYADTAMAVERILADGDSTQAAIASEAAARLHGLPILERDITNQRDNYTRFLVIALEPIECDLRLPCKTLVVFATRHQKGALAACLNELADRGLNLTKLESRPRKASAWEYLFYADFHGNTQEPRVADALEALAGLTRYLRVLGCYPSHDAVANLTPRQPAIVSDSDARGKSGSQTLRVVPAPPVSDDDAPPATVKSPYKLMHRGNRADTVVRVGELEVGGGQPILIAGPCSVESEDQIRECAEAVRAAGGHMLRGGCFKPRTSPYSFQGLGYDGLDLLAAAGREAGLPVITEVLQPADVQRVALKSDVLQVGARNMQNFALLREVGHAQRPVLLKRGMMSSIDEWLGAAEYILAHGNQEVILCERGIRTFETATRGTLDLTAIPVVRERTHLPVIVDPSHAAGERRWVPALAHAALACGAHGVMVEIHPCPSEALSDGDQSMTLPGFARFTEGLASSLTPPRT